MNPSFFPFFFFCSFVKDYGMPHKGTKVPFWHTMPKSGFRFSMALMHIWVGGVWF
jgi:hypothetical protein